MIFVLFSISNSEFRAKFRAFRSITTFHVIFHKNLDSPEEKIVCEDERKGGSRRGAAGGNCSVYTRTQPSKVTHKHTHHTSNTHTNTHHHKLSHKHMHTISHTIQHPAHTNKQTSDIHMHTYNDTTTRKPSHTYTYKSYIHTTHRFFSRFFHMIFKSTLLKCIHHILQ